MASEAMMIQQPHSLSEDCARLGRELRLGAPAPEAVLVGALQDPEYARNLFVCRETPPMLHFLLNNPPQPKAIAIAPQQTSAPEHSTLELVSKASKSFWAWTKSGFQTVTDEVYAARLASCTACPKLMTHPEKAAYALVSLNDKICADCGCVVAKKAKLPHETCPASDPQRPGLNRWGELISQ